MHFFKNINKRRSAAKLASQGMVDAESVSINEISGHIFLLRQAIGETWKSTSKEAAAGMALVILAKNVELKNFLNPTGWKLVISFVISCPDVAKNLSPRTIGEIFSYQAAVRQPMQLGFA
jgi:hypothetical protein